MMIDRQRNAVLNGVRWSLNIMKRGEWVQVYTRRGAPMRGRFRWRSSREKWQEIAAGIIIAAAMVAAVVLPALLSVV